MLYDPSANFGKNLLEFTPQLESASPELIVELINTLQFTFREVRHMETLLNILFKIAEEGSYIKFLIPNPETENLGLLGIVKIVNGDITSPNEKVNGYESTFADLHRIDFPRNPKPIALANLAVIVLQRGGKIEYQAASQEE